MGKRRGAPLGIAVAAGISACARVDAPQLVDESDASGIGLMATSASETGPRVDSSATGELLDVGVQGSGTGHGGDCMGGTPSDEYEFSYIWIANSPEGTVSKVNTFNGVEEGRYRTGPTTDADPSRTSVNQYGDVAVANRNGGITKIAAQLNGCVDTNANGSIETSSGPTDILAWGQDECVLWHVPLPALGAAGPRPVAWEPVDSQCGTVMPRVWVGHYTDAAADTGIFYRLDGATGDILDQVEVDGWDFGTNPRPYGGAVNADGDLFVTGYYGPGIRIDAETLAVDYFMPPPELGFYGMALDQDGRMWIGSCEAAIWHFDPLVGDFEKIADIEGRARGVQVDRKGRAWFAGNNPCRLLMVDIATKQLVEDAIALPGCGMPVGVSIDVEGYVWVVDQTASVAYKVDPETYEVVVVVEGLVGPYTYSDMTGGGLSLVANPPVG